MSEPTHFEKVADYVMSNDGSELSMVKAERDYALHCLEREIAIGEQDRARIEAGQMSMEVVIQRWNMEARQLEDAANQDDIGDDEVMLNKYCAEQIRRCIRDLEAALTPEQEK